MKKSKVSVKWMHRKTSVICTHRTHAHRAGRMCTETQYRNECTVDWQAGSYWTMVDERALLCSRTKTALDPCSPQTRRVILG